MTSYRLVLWDQLSVELYEKGENLLFVEAKDLMTSPKHHQKKLVFLLSSMRHFSDQMAAEGYSVTYLKNQKTLLSAIEGKTVVVTEPSEYWIREMLKRHVTFIEDIRNICSTAEFRQWATGRKELIMEYFYREMRKKTNFLMEGNSPLGGKWNYDKDNRKPLKGKQSFCQPMHFDVDKVTQEVIEDVKANFGNHFGVCEPFWYGVTRKQALTAMDKFIKEGLPRFGSYQDAMAENEPFLFHSVLSIYINAGLLDPLEVCEAAEEAYFSGAAPLNAVEGFIRQIIGWREFIRGVYNLYMPDYKQQNFLKATRPLPEYFWTGQTDMNCISQAVKMTHEHAYSHHIQRLMVTGNFALLSGLNPAEVCDWYWIVYADAHEWVELPNTLGMALHGDGGVVGTKPYVSSGAYINRMSNFCKGCRYNVKERLGENACPFNFLYWNFLIVHREQFQNNRRMALVYKNLDKISLEDQEAILFQAKNFLE